ncbi:hypothetical protein [Rossellomorea sp. NS-SX7]|uniref:hypothetical protein n=1 Tax=Rossellomorea sp. NS-SX7 TaxID=3463856 RepID=UPI00405912DD
MMQKDLGMVSFFCNLVSEPGSIGDIVPGSNQTFCAWLKTVHLCLAQIRPFVPGSKQFICAWLKTCHLNNAPNPAPQDSLKS